MKKFVVFSDGSFVDVDKIVAVYDDSRCGGTTVSFDQISGEGESDLVVQESLKEVRALIKKALEGDVEFIS